MARLSKEREAEIRGELANWCFGTEAGDRLRDLLAELDAVRVERDEAREEKAAYRTALMVERSADLALLAQLRAHPGLGVLLRVADDSAAWAVSGSNNAFEVLLRLLRGGE